jgi:hypothetical protein
MRLEPLYTVTFTTPEAWSVEVVADAGIEGRSFLLAEGQLHRAPLGPLPRGQLPSEAGRRGAGARVSRGA